MRRVGYWLTATLLATLALAVWGGWTFHLATQNRALANALEAERQRNFTDMAYHVEQIQALLGKGLATGDERQNMRYMADVSQHASAAVAAFTSLPLPAEISATTGKFLQQVGDFSLSLLRNEAAGRSMGPQERTELARLRQESAKLSEQMSTMMTQYSRGGFRWHQPPALSWAALFRGPENPVMKPGGTQDQAMASLVSGGWEQMSSSLEKLPVFIYDGPFSDHVDQTPPAVAGLPVTAEEAAQRLPAILPDAGRFRTVAVTEVGGNLPAHSFQLAPTNTQGNAYTVTVEITKQGGHLLQLLNGRLVGEPVLDLPRARAIAQDFLVRAGFPGMVPTFGQVQDGSAFIAFAYQENGVMIYPDQAKVKVALDNGEILGVDTRQYLTRHRTRSLPAPRVSEEEAAARVARELVVSRVQPAVIPDAAGTGERLTWEFMGKMGEDTYLVYINAETGKEEQILQVIETDGGTFAL